MAKICDVAGVRADGPVELWRDDQSGRLLVRIITECGYARVDLDLWDIILWAASGHGREADVHSVAPLRNIP